MTTPYRARPPTPSCVHTQECCGKCHAAVGGCLVGVTFNNGKLRAGATMDRPDGTPPLAYCTTHGAWEPTRKPDDG